MDVEGTPLLRAGIKVSPFHMKIPGTNCLGTQTVKQRHLSPWSDTHWGERKTERGWRKRGKCFYSQMETKIFFTLKSNVSVWSSHELVCMSVCWHILQLTICIFQGLFLLGRLGDDLDPLAEEDSDVGAVPVQHLHGQHEVLPFIRVADIQRLSCAEVLTQGKDAG